MSEQVDRFLEAREKLKSLKFKGLEDCEAFHYLERFVLNTFRQDFSPISFKKYLLHFLRSGYGIKFTESADGKNLFYFAGAYVARKDFKPFFDNLLPYIDNVMPVPVDNPKFTLSCVPYLFCIPSWKRTLSELKLGKKETRYLTAKLARCAYFYKLLKKNENKIKNASSYISLNDENFDEALFSEFCRKNGIPTVDLSHGHYDVISPDIPETLTNTLLNFNSDYYFAWGEYAKRVAVESGIPAKKIKVVGNPRFINQTKPVPSSDKVFGVVLDGGTDSLGSNRSMLRYADAIADKFGYKYIIKPHPVYDMKVLDGAYNKENVIEICEKFLKVFDYAEKVEFTIASGSSVYLELICMGQKVLRSVCDSYPDRYRYLGEWGRITNESDAVYLVEEMKQKPEQFEKKMKAFKTMLCADGDIGENYRTAINEISRK